MFDLTGKRALVTGSSQGIGKEIAKTLADHGATVYVHCSSLSEKLTEAAKYVGTDKLAVGDISEKDIAELLYSQTGDVDILILNASVQKKKPWDAFDEAEFEYHINCNLKSSYFLTKKYVEGMKKQGWGRVITVGSVNQYNNHPELLLYGITKAAQKKMTQNIAPYAAKHGITVNNIAPGAIDTPRNAAALSDETFRQKVISSIPAGYIGDVKDIVGAALLLCSDEGRYITGADIVIDGGMSL